MHAIILHLAVFCDREFYSSQCLLKIFQMWGWRNYISRDGYHVAHGLDHMVLCKTPCPPSCSFPIGDWVSLGECHMISWPLFFTLVLICLPLAPQSPPSFMWWNGFVVTGYFIDCEGGRLDIITTMSMCCQLILSQLYRRFEALAFDPESLIWQHEPTCAEWWTTLPVQGDLGRIMVRSSSGGLHA